LALYQSSLQGLVLPDASQESFPRGHALVLPYNILSKNKNKNENQQSNSIVDFSKTQFF